MPYYVYVLKSEATGKYYIGHTNNLERRLLRHNDPEYKGSRYTKRQGGPWRLVFKERFLTRAEAMKREKDIKRMKSRDFLESLVAEEGSMAESRQSRD